MMNQTNLDLPNFDGKLVAITGAGFDIGRALSIKFAEAGATVVLIDKDAKALEQLYDILSQAMLPEPIIAELDLGRLEPETAQLIAKQLYDEFGALDLLVHTADWAFPLSPLSLYDEKAMQQAMHHCHYVPWLLTKYLIPVLSHAKKANVIFTGHASGAVPKAFWGPYGAASAALENTCDIWNDELSHKGLAFSIVRTDKVMTQVRKKHFPAEDQEFLLMPNDPSVLKPYFEALVS